MNRPLRYCVFLFFIFLVACANSETVKGVFYNTTSNEGFQSKGGIVDFLPTSSTGVVIQREGFVFSYSEANEQSEWVAYELKPSDLRSSSYKRPFFVEDPKVETRSADWRNYKKSGFDKGHLCPAGDRKSNYDLYKETFFTSNIAPQVHEFNTGVWNRLEEKVRYWSKKKNGLYVFTGGVLSENLKTIGKEKVSVPKYFYKILATTDCSEVIGFLMPNQKSNQPLYEFVVDIDSIESLTGIDFFSQLPNEIENELEKKSDYNSWSF